MTKHRAQMSKHRAQDLLASIEATRRLCELIVRPDALEIVETMTAYIKHTLPENGGGDKE